MPLNEERRRSIYYFFGGFTVVLIMALVGEVGTGDIPFLSHWFLRLDGNNSPNATISWGGQDLTNVNNLHALNSFNLNNTFIINKSETNQSSIYSLGSVTVSGSDKITGSIIYTENVTAYSGDGDYIDLGYFFDGNWGFQGYATHLDGGGDPLTGNVYFNYTIPSGIQNAVFRYKYGDPWVPNITNVSVPSMCLYSTNLRMRIYGYAQSASYPSEYWESGNNVSCWNGTGWYPMYSWYSGTNGNQAYFGHVLTQQGLYLNNTGSSPAFWEFTIPIIATNISTNYLTVYNTTRVLNITDTDWLIVNFNTSMNQDLEVNGTLRVNGANSQANMAKIGDGTRYVGAGAWDIGAGYNSTNLAFSNDEGFILIGTENTPATPTLSILGSNFLGTSNPELQMLAWGSGGVSAGTEGFFIQQNYGNPTQLVNYKGNGLSYIAGGAGDGKAHNLYGGVDVDTVKWFDNTVNFYAGNNTTTKDNVLSINVKKDVGTTFSMINRTVFDYMNDGSSIFSESWVLSMITDEVHIFNTSQSDKVASAFLNIADNENASHVLVAASRGTHNWSKNAGMPLVAARVGSDGGFDNVGMLFAAQMTNDSGGVRTSFMVSTDDPNNTNTIVSILGNHAPNAFADLYIQNTNTSRAIYVTDPTKINTNLNADLLDSLHASSFVLANGSTLMQGNLNMNQYNITNISHLNMPDSTGSKSLDIGTYNNPFFGVQPQFTTNTNGMVFQNNNTAFDWVIMGTNFTNRFVPSLFFATWNDSGISDAASFNIIADPDDNTIDFRSTDLEAIALTGNGGNFKIIPKVTLQGSLGDATHVFRDVFTQTLNIVGGGKISYMNLTNISTYGYRQTYSTETAFHDFAATPTSGETPTGISKVIGLELVPHNGTNFLNGASFFNALGSNGTSYYEMWLMTLNDSNHYIWGRDGNLTLLTDNGDIKIEPSSGETYIKGNLTVNGSTLRLLNNRVNMGFFATDPKGENAVLQNNGTAWLMGSNKGEHNTGGVGQVYNSSWMFVSGLGPAGFLMNVSAGFSLVGMNATDITSWLDLLADKEGHAKIASSTDLNISAANITLIGNVSIKEDLTVTDTIQADSYKSGDGSLGITDTSSYWLCTASDCSTSCQVSIKDGLITGCT